MSLTLGQSKASSTEPDLAMAFAQTCMNGGQASDAHRAEKSAQSRQPGLKLDRILNDAAGSLRNDDALMATAAKQ